MRLTILGLWLAASSYACSCNAYPSVSEAWANAAAVVIGEVTRAESADPDTPRQTAWVTVLESFKGPAKGAEMIFQQPGHSCSPRFKAGTRLLLYAHRSGEAWEVYGCGRGSGFEAEDLLFLRNLPRSAATTRLSGTISLYDVTPTEGFRRVRPLSGLTVQISGPAGARQVVTNSDGVYEAYGLLPGDYEVTPKLPPGLKVRSSMATGKHELKPKVTLRDGSNAGIGFVIQEDNRISGHVLGPDGKPMRDVCLDLETLDGQKYGQAFTCTKGDGSYAFENMPRGQYRIVANRADRPTGAMPFRATYYPGAADRAQATIVTVSPVARQSGFDLRIAKFEKRAIFTGRVQFRDGVPIAGASIEITQNGQTIERSRSGDNGTFEIAALDGGKGELRASVLAGPEVLKQCPHWQSYAYAFTMTSQTVQLSLDAPQSGFYLTVSVSSCPGHLPGK